MWELFLEEIVIASLEDFILEINYFDVFNREFVEKV